MGNRNDVNIIKFIESFPDENSCREHFRGIREHEGIVCKKMWLQEALLAEIQVAMAMFRMPFSDHTSQWDYDGKHHVTIYGSDNFTGSYKNPFKTISKAAIIAMPGDTITVHEGIYREWIRPTKGGINDKKRILFRAATGEKVSIKGSEIISSWQNENKGVWNQERASD